MRGGSEEGARAGGREGGREMSADDVFVSFVQSARGMLCESFQTELQKECNGEKFKVHGPSWSWVCTRILSCCKAYPHGVTSAILLSELYESWLERVRIERFMMVKGRNGADSMNNDAYQLRKQKQLLGTKVTTIDSILEKKFVSSDAVLDVIIIDIQLLPGSTTYLLTLGDAWSFNTIELYLHSKFYDLVGDAHGILRKSREIRLTCCCLRNAVSWGSHLPRLLPTEFIVILLDEEQEDDLVLLGAKFCNDYFSGIQLNDIKSGTDYYFYARVMDMEVFGAQGQQGHAKQLRITLRDDNGDVLPLILWNEQVLKCKEPGGLAFHDTPVNWWKGFTKVSGSSVVAFVIKGSKGSMVAIERPSIVYAFENDNCTVTGPWFEYASHTRLYTIPYMQTGEQVITLEDTHLSNNTTGLSLVEASENCQRILVGHVQPKMSNVALYGLVTHLSQTSDMNPGVKHDLAAYQLTYLLRIGDSTGILDINLYFKDHWSAGEIHVGQMVFICGIATSIGLDGRLECTWTQSPGGISLVNITQLPALLSTSCLHRVVPLSKVSSSSLTVQVCRVRIGSLVQHRVQVKYCHVFCGHPLIGQPVPGLWRCDFCGRPCDNNETTLTFFMTALLLDTYPGHKTQVYATCSGLAAREILQTEAEDFFSWPEIDQGMYLCSLENEQFLVTLYSGLQDDMGTFQTAGGSLDGGSVTCLRIGQALKASPD